MKLTTIETKTVPTIQLILHNKSIVFHSKYDPLNEASIWCKNESANLKQKEDIIIIGVGAGYHILKLSELAPQQNIIVIEFNDIFFNWFRASPFFDPIKKSKNITMKQFSRLSSTEKKTIFSSVSPTNLLIHKSGLDILPSEYQGIKEALEDIKLQQNSLHKQLENLVDNFQKNSLLNDRSIDVLKDTYKNRPMILVSAGPSLDKQLPLLKKIWEEKHIVIGVVGTAIKPLQRLGIIPDFFVIIDPNIETFTQLTDIELDKTPLFYLSTAYHETVLLHKGPRYIVFQKGYDDAENFAAKKNLPTIQTGGSVATALLDIMVYLGGESIALIGQDLAYTDGKSHADLTHDQIEIKAIQNAKKVMNYFQTGEVHSANNLILFKKWFERYAKNNPHLLLYNCTEGGAFIQNWEHILLTEYYKKYSL